MKNEMATDTFIDDCNNPNSSRNGGLWELRLRRMYLWKEFTTRHRCLSTIRHNSGLYNNSECNIQYNTFRLRGRYNKSGLDSKWVCQCVKPEHNIESQPSGGGECIGKPDRPIRFNTAGLDCDLNNTCSSRTGSEHNRYSNSSVTLNNRKSNDSNCEHNFNRRKLLRTLGLPECRPGFYIPIRDKSEPERRECIFNKHNPGKMVSCHTTEQADIRTQHKLHQLNRYLSGGEQELNTNGGHK